MGPINQRTGDSAICSSFLCSFQLFSPLPVQRKLLPKLTLMLSSVSFTLFQTFPLPYFSFLLFCFSSQSCIILAGLCLWYHFSHFLHLHPSYSYLPLSYLSMLWVAFRLLAQSASFKCCYRWRKEIMPGSPGEQSGLLITFLALTTMVVTTAKLGTYRRNMSASLHILYWGIYLQCFLLGGREKHTQHPALSPPLIKCTSGIVAPIQIYIKGRANLL